jgi:hypothetical protein
MVTKMIGNLEIPRDDNTKEHISLQRLHTAVTKWLAEDPERGCGNNKYLEFTSCPSEFTSCRTCAIGKENRRPLLKLIKQQSIALAKQSQ